MACALTHESEKPDLAIYPELKKSTPSLAITFFSSRLPFDVCNTQIAFGGLGFKTALGPRAGRSLGMFQARVRVCELTGHWRLRPYARRCYRFLGSAGNSTARFGFERKSSTIVTSTPSPWRHASTMSTLARRSNLRWIEMKVALPCSAGRSWQAGLQ